MNTEIVANPSIIFAGFGQFNERWDKFKAESHKKGIVWREIKVLEAQIPIDERYNDASNFLKQNITPILRSYIENIPFRDMIFKQLKNKAHLEFFNYKNFDKNFVAGNKYPFGYMGLTPLFVDTKYKDQFKLSCFDTDEEKDNYKKLFSLKSEGFKPLMTPTKEEECFHK